MEWTFFRKAPLSAHLLWAAWTLLYLAQYFGYFKLAIPV